MRNTMMTGVVALTLGVTLLQGAPETAAAAGSKSRPGVQSMKSVPVAKVKAKARARGQQGMRPTLQVSCTPPPRPLRPRVTPPRVCDRLPL